MWDLTQSAGESGEEKPVRGGNNNKRDNSNTKDGVVAQMWE